MDEIRNICVFGVGGVGGYFGGLLAHALTGEAGLGRKIFFVARGGHLKAIRESGLVLNTTARGTMAVKPAAATDRVEELPSPDLCLFCVKEYDLKDATARLAAIVTEETVILPLLNGVDIYERMKPHLSRGIVLPACVYVGTHIEKPGMVTQNGGDGVILSGRNPDFPEFNPARLISLFSEAGIRFVWNDDPYPAIWEKYIFIAGFGLVTAFSGKAIGEVAADVQLSRMVREIMEEIKLIADDRRILLPGDVVETSMAKAGNFPYETRTSYQRDMEAKGGRNEGDLFGGTILRMGEELGIPTPATERVYEAIRRGDGASQKA